MSGSVCFTRDSTLGPVIVWLMCTHSICQGTVIPVITMLALGVHYANTCTHIHREYKFQTRIQLNAPWWQGPSDDDAQVQSFVTSSLASDCQGTVAIVQAEFKTNRANKQAWWRNHCWTPWPHCPFQCNMPDKFEKLTKTQNFSASRHK